MQQQQLSRPPQPRLETRAFEQQTLLSAEKVRTRAVALTSLLPSAVTTAVTIAVTIWATLSAR